MPSAPSRQRSTLKSAWTGTRSRTSMPAAAPRSCSRSAALTTGRVVVAGDIEPAQRRGRDRGRRGGWPRARRSSAARQHRFEREHRLDAFAGGEHPSRGGYAETDAVAEQMAERPARIGERRLVGPVRIEPGALDAGDRGRRGSVTAASRAGQSFERGASRRRGNRPTGGSAGPASRACGDAARAQIGLGRRAGDRAAGAEQAAGGFGRSAGRGGAWLMRLRLADAAARGKARASSMASREAAEDRG